MNNSENRYIYLIFSHTDTHMGSLIRAVTGFEFNHVSVSLSDKLNPIYSFARHYKDTPFYGGFVKESSARFIGDSRYAIVKICAIPVDEEQYLKANQYIYRLEKQCDQYIYNLASAAVFPFHINVHIEQAFTCIEFATELLRHAAIRRSNLIPHFCSIRTLERIYNKFAIYRGKLPSGAGTVPESDDYLRRNGLGYHMLHAAKNGGLLLYRMFLRYN